MMLCACTETERNKEQQGQRKTCSHHKVQQDGELCSWTRRTNGRGSQLLKFRTCCNQVGPAVNLTLATYVWNHPLTANCVLSNWLQTCVHEQGMRKTHITDPCTQDAIHNCWVLSRAGMPKKGCSDHYNHAYAIEEQACQGKGTRCNWCQVSLAAACVVASTLMNSMHTTQHTVHDRAAK